MRRRTLSKSDFKIGLSCATKLYYKEAGGYASTSDDDPYLQMLAEGGYMVEQLAKARYCDGIEIGNAREPEAAWLATRDAIEGGDVTLFEATLLHDRRLARIDILQRRGNRLRLIEVKAKSFDTVRERELAEKGKPPQFWTQRQPFVIASDWRDYIADVTYQVLLLESLFPDMPVDPFLCLVDKSATTLIDGLPEWFELTREIDKNGASRLVTARITGDIAKAAEEKLTVEIPVRDEVDAMRAEVETSIHELLAMYEPELHRPEPTIELACKACEYRVAREKLRPGLQSGFYECWGSLADVKPSMLDIYWASDIKGANGGLVNELIRQGKAGQHDLPGDVIDSLNNGKSRATRQWIQLTHTRDNAQFIGRGLKPALESVRYPLHFIDFEAARIAIPFHSAMTPYGLLAFQWSCHVQDGPGLPLRHLEWINTERRWPNEAFARSLMHAIGNDGTVLTWSAFEVSTLRAVRAELEARGVLDVALRDWFERIAPPDKSKSSRVLDMHKMTLDDYFHPGMGGRTSIKVVLDALWKSDPAMRQHFADVSGVEGDPTVGPYASLQPLVIAGVEQSVAEGTGAIRAYEALMFGVERDDPMVQESWKRLLLEYCKLDTLAMVLIWEYWKREVK